MMNLLRILITKNKTKTLKIQEALEVGKRLISSPSLAVITVQAAKIKECFDQLCEFDRKPKTKIWTKSVYLNQRNHVWTTRIPFPVLFLSAGSPAKSRVVEAICIRLCDAIPSPVRESRESGQSREYKWALTRPQV